MTRFYHILLMILAPFCIIGMWAFSQVFCKSVFKHEKTIVVSLLIVAVLVPYFLFQTNLVYEVAKTESWSISLSGYRMNPIQLYGFFGFIDSYSAHGAQWVSANVPYRYNIAGDNGLYTSLTAYGRSISRIRYSAKQQHLLKTRRICLSQLHKYRIRKIKLKRDSTSSSQPNGCGLLKRWKRNLLKPWIS